MIVLKNMAWGYSMGHKREIQNGTWKFFSRRTLIVILAVILINAAAWIALHGCPLSGLPEEKNIKSITLIYNENGSAEVTREIQNAEDISLLVKAAGMCNYRMGKAGEELPEMTVVYHTKDGSDIELKASAGTVWWQGKKHPLKEENSFVMILKGLYFSE